jgi:hypothetical protein
MSLYLAERTGHAVDPETVPLIREYPATALPMLPFVEHGRRFTTVEYRGYAERCNARGAA